MKKTLNQTIIVLFVMSLITAGQVLAQDVVEEENKELIETQAKEEAAAQREAEIAAKETERQVLIAREKMKNAEKQIKEAEKQLLISREQAGMYKDKLADLRLPKLPKIALPHLQHVGRGSVLVIPSDQMKIENLAEITEDMSIMSRIFDEQLSRANLVTGRGRLYGNINPFLGHGNRTTEAIYLEGYGALFLMKVNILLSAPPEAKQKEKVQEDADPVWTDMRRQMYEPEEVRRRRGSDRLEEKYDAEKVESLKTNLIKTLKHAANIRALKPDQLVILTIIGNGNQSASNITQSFSYGRSAGSRGVVQMTAPGNAAASLLPTVLTISVKKSDIDAFAKGELDYDQFRKRTGIFQSYAKAGQHDSPGVEVHQVAHEEHQIVHQEHPAF